MNKRSTQLIQEMARRAGATDEHGHQAGPVYSFTEQELDDFAKLIVQECVNICEVNGDTYQYSYTPAKARLANSTSKYCGMLIKKHFGVEQ